MTYSQWLPHEDWVKTHKLAKVKKTVECFICEKPHTVRVSPRKELFNSRQPHICWKCMKANDEVPIKVEVIEAPIAIIHPEPEVTVPNKDIKISDKDLSLILKSSTQAPKPKRSKYWD